MGHMAVMNHYYISIPFKIKVILFMYLVNIYFHWLLDKRIADKDTRIVLCLRAWTRLSLRTIRSPWPDLCGQHRYLTSVVI